MVDATSAGCDAGIRYGEQLAKDTIAVPIGPRPQTLALAAALSYLALQDLPSHSADLAEHDCIRLKYSSGALIPWQVEWQGKTVSVNPAGRLIIGVNGAAVAIEFARQGRGIIATFENGLQPDFETGELVAVLPEWWSAFKGPWLYFPSRFMSAPLRAFVDFLKQDAVAQSS